MSNSDSDRKCVKFFQRKDGTITTDECPRFLRPIRDQYKRAAYLVSMISALIISVVGGVIFYKMKDVPKSIEIFQYFPVDPRYGQTGEVGGGLGGTDLVDSYFHEIEEGVRILSEDVLSRLTLNELYLKRTFEVDILEQLEAVYSNNNDPLKAFKCNQLIVAVKLEDSRFASRKVELISNFEDRRQTEISNFLNAVDFSDLFVVSDVLSALRTSLAIADCKPSTLAFTTIPIEYHNRIVYKDGHKFVQLAFDNDNKILFRQLLDRIQPITSEDIAFRNKMLTVFPPLEN
ncbi:MAG: hypothetical protein SFY67_00245 [Candidatus Melainabacteria bacterium]|nr:hypothetical protein [Candidatus Melainabacteria bacterium]